MHFSYEQIDVGFLARITDENGRRLSRTHRGVSDTSASERKAPLLLTGNELKQRTVENERRALGFILSSRADAPPTGARDVVDLLYTVADLVSAGLLPSGRLRTWDVSYQRDDTPDDGWEPSPCRPVPFAVVPQALDRFCATIQTRWGELAVDPVPLAAWAEWHLNPGPLHPFYDGCGRVSRLFAALLLVRASWLIPLYGERKMYFEHAAQGPTRFTDYLRSRIADCAAWLGTVPR